MGVWSTQLAENEIRKLEQEVLDSIVDRFGPNTQTVRIDEYTVRFPYRRYAMRRFFASRSRRRPGSFSRDRLHFASRSEFWHAAAYI